MTSLSSVEHGRVRRGVMDLVARVWKGFHFDLKTPSVDWQKKIGGSALGASFGLVLKNSIDIAIGMYNYIGDVGNTVLYYLLYPVLP